MAVAILFQIFIILLLLASSAFFAGSETALSKLSKIKVKHWIYSRSSNREAWANWLSKPQELITTILAGNTLLNIFISTATVSLAMNIFHKQTEEWVQTISGMVAFFLILVFGEIVPKLYALQNPEKISSITLAPLFNLSKFIGTPLKKFLELLGQFSPIFGQPTPSRVSVLTLDEIRAILLDPASLKGLEKESQDMMRRVLESHRTTVSQIMTPWKNIDFLVMEEALAGGTKMERFIDYWVESGHTRLPVVKGQPPKVFGYLYVKDLLSCIAQAKRVDPLLCQKWVRTIPVISAEKKISELLNLFRFGAPVACVQDRSGFPLGIITLEDILEEFVGEILDEYDLEEKESQSLQPQASDRPT